jgi:hypothetical protein
MTGKIEVLYVNTYGNYSSNHLNGGFCFKIEGYEHYLKIAYADSGEKRKQYKGPFNLKHLPYTLLLLCKFC